MENLKCAKCLANFGHGQNEGKIISRLKRHSQALLVFCLNMEALMITIGAPRALLSELNFPLDHFRARGGFGFWIKLGHRR